LPADPHVEKVEISPREKQRAEILPVPTPETPALLRSF
jgi:hypothetical protein